MAKSCNNLSLYVRAKTKNLSQEITAQEPEFQCDQDLSYEFQKLKYLMSKT